MKPDCANVWETLLEALHVYCQVVRDKWLPLLAAIVPVQLLLALYRLATASGGPETASSLRVENFVACVLLMTIGLLPVAIAVGHAYFKCTGRRPSGSGILAAWGRMMATALLRMLAIGGMAFLASLAIAALLAGVAAPLSRSGGTSFALAIAVAFVALVPIVALFVWILVRWSFAVVLSAIRQDMGSEALGESWRFMRGRVPRCMLLIFAAWLVGVGISAVPDALATLYARGETFGLVSLPGTAGMRIAAMFLSGIFTSFSGLFLSVAMVLFWLRTNEPSDMPDRVRGDCAGRWAVALLLLGVAAYAFWAVVGFKVGVRAREELAKERESQSAAMHGPAESRRGEPVVNKLPEAYRQDSQSVLVQNGEMVVGTPFDLCIGSTECAKMLGDRLHQGLSEGATQYWSASARLPEPYFGCENMALAFYGEEKALGVICLGVCKQTLDECRKTARDMADEIGRRFGVKMDMVLDITDVQALNRGERRRSRLECSHRRCEFLSYQTKMDSGRGIVRYDVRGLVDSETRELSVELKIGADKR